MMGKGRSALLVATVLLAACGSREGLWLGEPAVDDAGSAGSGSAGRGGGSISAGAPNHAGAPPVSGGAPGAGAPGAGAPGAGAGGAPIACTGDGVNCPNGFNCIAGTCTTHCESREQCRADRFCAGGDACSLKATQIASGSSDTCVLLVDGSVRCWGDGQAGQLGDGSQETSATPVTVKPIQNSNGGIRELTLGMSFACAVVALGRGSCWGAGDLGQLGAGNLNPSSTPVPIANINGGDPLLSIGAGRYHACGLFSSGSVRCWGANFDGQLGDATTTSQVSPVLIAAAPDPTTIQVVSGDAHTCILSGQQAPGLQTVRCWGDNSSLQLGVNGLTRSSSPVTLPSAIATNSNIVDLAAGANHTCALNEDGTLLCWGDNSQGQLGVPQPTQSAQPRQVLGLPTPELPIAISAGEHHSCALMSNQTVVCWGNGMASGSMSANTPAVRIAGLSGDNVPTAIAAGKTHTCALMLDGSARCWGSNNDGALGVPDIGSSVAAIPVQAW